MALRIAVIGARRQRQGTGAFLARFCAEAGAEVAALLGTSRGTVETAVLDLVRATGTRARGYTDLGALLAAEALDVLVIAGPQESHAAYLQQALRAGLHVLCEKPLLWGGPAPAAEAAFLAQSFLKAGLHLKVNTQWPLTLSTYGSLYPDVLSEPARFFMRMSPLRTGPDMLLDCLPHPLSLLAAVCPDPEASLSQICVSGGQAGDLRAEVRLVYEAAGRAIACRIELVHCKAQPRPAAYGFNDRIAHRLVQLDPYRFQLEGEGRRIPLPDPTPLLVGSLLAAVEAGASPGLDAAAVPGMRHLARIVAAPRDALANPPSDDPES